MFIIIMMEIGNMIRIFLATILFFGIIGLSGCIQKDNGTLAIQITDAPAGLNIQKASVTISNLEVHSARSGEDANTTTETGWFTVVEEEKTFDLIAIKDVKEFLGSSELKAG